MLIAICHFKVTNMSAIFALLLVLGTVRAAEECVDISVGCEKYAQYCNHESMRENCAKTCGSCNGGGHTTLLPKDCYDKINSCKKNEKKCHETKIQYWCPKTCGVEWSCPGQETQPTMHTTTTKPTPPPDCRDISKGCERFTEYCDHENMRKNCAKTCKSCDGGGKTTLPPPDCPDKINSCKENKKKCHETKIQYWCPRTCGTPWACGKGM